MGRDGKNVERAFRLRGREARLGEIARPLFAHHALRARARGHPLCLDADDSAHPAGVGVRDPDQRVGLLAALAADRRPALESELGAQPHVGAPGIVRVDDRAREPAGEILDPGRCLRPREDVEGDLLQQLGEARHVDAGPARRQIGDHRELATEHRLAAVDREVDDAPKARHAGAVDREFDLGFLVLPVRDELQGARLALDAGAAGGRRERGDRLPRARIDEIGCDLRKRNQVEGTLGEVGLRHGKSPEVGNEIVDQEDVDIDRPGRERTRRPSTDGLLDGAQEALEFVRSQRGLRDERDVEEGRAGDTGGGLRFIVGRDGLDPAARPQTLQRLRDVALAVAEV